MDKVDRTKVNYRRATTSKTCDNCEYMNTDGTCDRVYGIVHPQDVCDLWSKG